MAEVSKLVSDLQSHCTNGATADTSVSTVDIRSQWISDSHISSLRLGKCSPDPLCSVEQTARTVHYEENVNILDSSESFQRPDESEPTGCSSSESENENLDMHSFLAELDNCGEWKTRAVDDMSSDDDDDDGDTDNSDLRPQRDEVNIRDKLADWAVMFNISQSALSKLLEVLQTVGIEGLPKDARTLLCTDSGVCETDHSLD